jgi:uncharacterized glyoxalase superfamily protein PhnB
VENDLVRDWSAVYAHLTYADPIAAISWLERAFGFRERVRVESPERFITSKLESPAGGLIMVVGQSAERNQSLREALPEFTEGGERSWPYLSHTMTVMVPDVVAHHGRAKDAGALVLGEPKEFPWGLCGYNALDLEGHRWEFVELVQTREPEEWGGRRIG